MAENPSSPSALAIQKAAKLVGSLYKLQQLTDISYVTIHKWAKGKAVPTPLNCMKVEKATHGLITKEEIRPEFDWENFELI